MTEAFRSRVRAAALGAGCAAVVATCWRGTLPARELYRLIHPMAATDSRPLPDDGGSVLPGAMAIAPFTTPGMYGEENIVYRIGEVEYGQYPSRLWALPLGQMLGVLAETELSRHPLTSGGAVFDPPARHRYDYIWQATVREFEEVNRGDTVLAAVRFEARILRPRDDSVLWSGSVRLERRVASPTMPAIVATLSELAAEAVRQLGEESRSILGASAAARHER